MDLRPLIEFALSLGINYYTALTAPLLKDLFDKTISNNPELESEIHQLGQSPSKDDTRRVYEQVVSRLVADAKSGKITIESAILRALEIELNHGQGELTVSGTYAEAEQIQIGGNDDAKGNTSVTNSHLKSTSGSEIIVGEGAYIHVSGGAQIKQT